MKEAGSRLLDAADAAGLRPVAAAWLYDHDLAEWRFFLVSPLVGVVEKRRLYSVLGTIMKDMDLPEDFSIVDVYLDGTHGLQFKIIAKAIGIPGNQRVWFEECRFDGLRVDGLVYRFDAANTNVRPEDIRLFEKKERDLERAARKRMKSKQRAEA